MTDAELDAIHQRIAAYEWDRHGTDREVLLDEVDQLRKALAEEREACAKIADEKWDGLGQKGDRANVAKEIADAIRKGNNQP